jgi:hypothetical protein
MKIAASVLFSTLALTMVSVANACSCRPWTGDLEQDVQLSFAEATAVIVAEALEQAGSSSTAFGGETQDQTVKWEVAAAFKGTHVRGHRITTKTDTSLCGVYVEVGQTFLLYLYGEPPYYISTCSLSGELQYNVRQIPVLDRLQAAAMQKAED